MNNKELPKIKQPDNKVKVNSSEWISTAQVANVPEFLQGYILAIYFQPHSHYAIHNDNRNLFVIKSTREYELGYSEYLEFELNESLTVFFRNNQSIPDAELGEALRRQNVDASVLNGFQENADRKTGYNRQLVDAGKPVSQRMSIGLTNAMMRAGFDPFVFEAVDWLATHALRCYSYPIYQAETKKLLEDITANKEAVSK